MRKLTSAQINAYVAFFPGEEEKDNIPGLKFPFRYVPSRFYLLGSASRQLDVEKTVVCKHDETGAIHAVSVGSAQTVRRAFPWLLYFSLTGRWPFGKGFRLLFSPRSYPYRLIPAGSLD